MLDDIRIFIHVARSQALSAAAKHLGIPTATVTRRLQKLEDHLGCKLINRSARHFSLTAEGEAYFDAYADQIQKFEDINQSLTELTKAMTGDLHVMAPTNISTGLLHPMWVEYVKEHPNVRLKLNVSNQLQNMLAENVDIALRIGPLPDSSLYQQRLGRVTTVLITSPEYLNDHSIPKNIDDLRSHKIITSTNLSNWVLYHSGSKNKITVRPETSIEVNDIQIVRKFVLQHLGISLLPKSEIHEDLKSGRLVQILPDWIGPYRDIYAVWPSGKLLNSKAKALKTHMQKFIKNIDVLNE